jgi:thiamine kinase-like enzyme
MDNLTTMKDKTVAPAPSSLTRASNSGINLKQLQASIYRDNASKILNVVVDPSAASETFHRQLKQVAITLCPFLVNGLELDVNLDGCDPLGIDIDVDADDNVNLTDDDDDNLLKDQHNSSVNDLNAVLESLEVKPLLGGLSNELFIVQQCVTIIPSSDSFSGSSSSSSNNDNNDDNDNDNDTRAVLIRIHPPESSDGCEIVNRDAENELMAWMSLATTLAPAYYGRFTNGRVEEFYEGHVTLSFRDMPNYAAEIASLLQQMHACQPPANVLPNHNLNRNGGGDIWRAVEKWWEMIDSQQGKNDASSSFGDFDVQELKTEWNWLQSVLREGHGCEKDASIADKAIAFASEIVLTHMDGQSLNLLRPDDSLYSPLSGKTETDNESEMKPLRIIDFEYAGWNPRAVDISNTFCEHCDMNNLQADYEKEYPSDKVQEVFLRSYLAGLESSSPLEGLTEDEQTLFITALQQEIGRYTLVSHLQWSVWSLVQHRLSSIDFDYIAYAEHRMLGYRYFKQKFF